MLKTTEGLASVGLAAMLFINGCSGNKPAPSSNERNKQPDAPRIVNTPDKALGNPMVVETQATPIVPPSPEGFSAVPISTDNRSQLDHIPNTNVSVTQLGESRPFISHFSTKGIETMAKATDLSKFRRVTIALDPSSPYFLINAVRSDTACDAHIQMGYTANIGVGLENQIRILSNEEVEKNWNQHNQGLLWRMSMEISKSTDINRCLFTANDKLEPELVDVQKNIAQKAPYAFWHSLRPNWRFGTKS